jgi:hypothetical protein
MRRRFADVDAGVDAGAMVIGGVIEVSAADALPARKLLASCESLSLPRHARADEIQV